MSELTPPITIKTEAWLGATLGWVDISGYVYQRNGLSIRRGRADEQTRVGASSLSLTLNNRDNRFTPQNAVGPYYGLFGRNTRLRVALCTIRDTFTRTVSGGWGTTDSGQAWSSGGAGGSVLASDHNVASGKATHSQPVVAGYRLDYLASTSYRDVDVAVSVTLPFTDVTGGPVEPANILVRGVSLTDHYMARVTVETNEAVTVKLIHFNGTEVAAAVTVAGLTHSSAQAIRVRVQAEGQTLRAKVWAAAGVEPYSWHVTGHMSTTPVAGWVGIRSGVSATNTNTLPIVFSYDDVEVRLPRFTGDLSSVRRQWDTSGTDQTVDVEAAGVLRRLGQGSAPVISSFRRGAVGTAVPGLRAYWPVEEGRDSTSIASALGGPPMKVTGSPNYASYSGFASSAPLPTMNSSRWIGVVPPYTHTGTAILRFFMSVPATGMTNNTTISRFIVGGSAAWWDLIYTTASPSGTLTLRAYDVRSNLLADSGAIAFAVNGKPVRMSIELIQDGADVDWAMTVLEYDSKAAGGFSGTLAGATIGAAQRVWMQVSNVETMTDTAIGHITVQDTFDSLFNLGDPFVAWRGETAGNRLKRLCAEDGIDFSYIGDLAATGAMGPQSITKLSSLLDECVDVDQGTLYESRATGGLVYRASNATYNQNAQLTLDYNAGELATIPQPTDDDQYTRNDVTANRVNGSSARVTVDTGRMSTLTPAAGGVGRYDTSVSVNSFTDAQLSNIAGWLANLGTVDEARYPTVGVNLLNPRVAANTTLVRNALGMDIDDRIDVTDLASDTITQLARGMTERLNAYELSIVYNLTPESPYEVLQLDSATLGRLDSATSTLASSVTSSATTLSVADSLAPGWTTDAGDMPFTIRVAGEVMTVTAISGASSPQTFTVTRSVNGVSKSHAAGTQVRLARPSILAL
jgi:hypothetical protein